MAAHELLRKVRHGFERTVARLGRPDPEITAETAEGEIMGLRHREFPIHGVQFHPESILTLEGKRLLKNFLAL